jgi:heat shock protein HtpX
MSYSFTKIEKERSRTITIVVGVLVVLYFISFSVIATIIKNYLAFDAMSKTTHVVWTMLTRPESCLVFTLALFLAVVQWLATISNLTPRILALMNAKDIDPRDPRQEIFRNILEEVAVATGGQSVRGVVIPSMALNAFAIDDGEAVPVIGVTNGLLFKLNRAQLEAVVAHEAAHVVSGDSKHTTIISAMFEVYSAFLRGIRYVLSGAFDSEDRTGVAVRLFRSFPVMIIIGLVVIVIGVVNVMAALMRMFISRQREYRADAVAVRLSRDPLSLAEALYIIGHRRRRLGDAGDAFESLFIVNPLTSCLDENEGILADLFSTHPPIMKRVQILMSMSRAKIENLDDALKVSVEKEKLIENELSRVRMQNLKERGAVWLAQKDQSWFGPYTMKTLSNLDWIGPDIRVKNIATEIVLPLMSVPQFQEILNNNPRVLKNSTACPACPGRLKDETYENVRIKRCDHCHGVLVGKEKVGTIIYRKVQTFDDRIKAMAETIAAETHRERDAHLKYEPSDRVYQCEDCRGNPRPLIRKLFNKYYPLEIDKCMRCGLTWFDKDELEILQYLCEKNEQNSRLPK